MADLPRLLQHEQRLNENLRGARVARARCGRRAVGPWKMKDSPTDERRGPGKHGNACSGNPGLRSLNQTSCRVFFG